MIETLRNSNSNAIQEQTHQMNLQASGEYAVAKPVRQPKIDSEEVLSYSATKTVTAHSVFQRRRK